MKRNNFSRRAALSLAFADLLCQTRSSARRYRRADAAATATPLRGHAHAVPAEPPCGGSRRSAAPSPPGTAPRS